MKTSIILSIFLVLAISCSDSGGETRVFNRGYICEIARDDISLRMKIYEVIEETHRSGTISIEQKGQNLSCWLDHGTNKNIGLKTQEISDWVGSCEIVDEDVTYQIIFDHESQTSEFIISAPDQEPENLNSDCEKLDVLITSYT